MYACAAAASASGKVRSISTRISPSRHAEAGRRSSRGDAGTRSAARRRGRPRAGCCSAPTGPCASTLGAGAARHPHADQCPAVGERADAVLQRLAADRIEDHVRAAPVGQLARPFDEVLGRVVDPVVEPELLEPLELLVAGRGCDHGGARLLGELDRRHPDASGARLDQDRLAGLEVAGGEEALLSGPDRNRHARRARRVQPSGIGHVVMAGMPPGGVRPGCGRDRSGVPVYRII